MLDSFDLKCRKYCEFKNTRHALCRKVFMSCWKRKSHCDIRKFLILHYYIGDISPRSFHKKTQIKHSNNSVCYWWICFCFHNYDLTVMFYIYMYMYDLSGGGGHQYNVYWLCCNYPTVNSNIYLFVHLFKCEIS